MYKNRFFTVLVPIALIVVLALTVREVFATSSLMLDPQTQEALNLQRGRAADAARWTAMSEYYDKLKQAQLERRRAADTARWNAMAEYYMQMQGVQP